MTVAVVIPALDEELSIGEAVRQARAIPGVYEVVVCDNGSRDDTAARARTAGARVITEPKRGYGRACLAALADLAARPPHTVLFMDADLADDPADAPALLAPIRSGQADMVIGSRIERAEPGALLPQARFGNWLATRLLRMLFGVEYSDLGPFRAIRWQALQMLAMDDEDFGWTVQMQARAARRGLRGTEVPVQYHRRVGRSKISGTVVGSIRAGTKIISTLMAERFAARSAVSKEAAQAV